VGARVREHAREIWRELVLERPCILTRKDVALLVEEDDGLAEEFVRTRVRVCTGSSWVREEARQRDAWNTPVVPFWRVARVVAFAAGFRPEDTLKALDLRRARHTGQIMNEHVCVCVCVCDGVMV
jgi:hypothetical protein